MAAGLLAFAMAGGAAADEAAPVNILLYGDSLMAGYGLDESEGFAARLNAALDEEGADVKITNASISGDTSASGAARLDWSLVVPPDLALVGLGANDMLRGQSVEALKTNLQAILDRFAAEDIPVLLLGMRANRGLGEDYVSAFDAVYPDLARHYDNVELYPFFLEGVAFEPSLNQPDGLHPNAQGVAEIVSRLTPHVVDLLEKTG